jgi:plastocyanin
MIAAQLVMKRKTSSANIALVALVSISALTAACGGSSSSPTTPSPGTGSGSLVTVFITNSVYSPNPLTVNVGQSVNWKNNDSIEHTATFDNGMYESGNIPALSAHDNPLPMNTKGTFRFHCRIHAGMTGTIVVQ